MRRSPHDQNITQNAQTVFTRIWTYIQNNVKHVAVAAVAITLFLGMTFSFAMKDNAKRQALGTAMLPVQEQAAPASEQPQAPVAVLNPVPKPEPADEGTAIGTGHASYYGDEFAGQQTANGETFNPSALTAAHKTLPFGSKVKVTNTANGKSVVVRVNDRGPYVAGRLIDLSHGAAKKIGMVGSGTANVRLELLS